MKRGGYCGRVNDDLEVWWQLLGVDDDYGVNAWEMLQRYGGAVEVWGCSRDIKSNRGAQEENFEPGPFVL